MSMKNALFGFLYLFINRLNRNLIECNYVQHGQIQGSQIQGGPKKLDHI